MNNKYIVKYGGLPVRSVLNVVWKIPSSCPNCNQVTNYLFNGWGSDWIRCTNCNYVAWLDNQTQ